MSPSDEDWRVGGRRVGISGLRPIVDVEGVRRLCEELAALDALDIEAIQWFEGGRPVAVPDGVARAWAASGRSVADFAATGAYRGDGEGEAGGSEAPEGTGG